MTKHPIESQRKLKKTANLISWIFHPLWMPTVGTALFFFYTYLLMMPLTYKLYLVATVSIFTLFIPALTLTMLHKKGIISDLEISKKEERLFPYTFVMISYAAGLFILWRIEAQPWVIGYLIGALISLLINSLITPFWKISAHMAGVGGVAGSIFAMMYLQSTYYRPLMISIVLIAGLLGSARIILKHHTLAQVLLGFLSGFTFVALAMVLATYLL